MEFDVLMQGFARGSGISALTPDDLGRYAVEIDGMAVTFRSLPDQGLLELSAEVCKLTDKVCDSLLQIMIEGMYMGEATCGSAFVYDEESEIVYLRHLDCLSALDETSFWGVVEKFVDVLEEWRGLAGGFADIADSISEAKVQSMSVARLMSLGGQLA